MGVCEGLRMRVERRNKDKGNKDIARKEEKKKRDEFVQWTRNEIRRIVTAKAHTRNEARCQKRKGETD